MTQGGAQEIWRVSPGANGRFDGVAPTGDDAVSHFDVAAFGSLDVEGIGYSPVRDTLFLADRRAKQIIEVSKAGELIQSIDVTAIGMKQPAGITLAPASNNPARTSMYVVTRAPGQQLPPGRERRRDVRAVGAGPRPDHPGAQQGSVGERRAGPRRQDADLGRARRDRDRRRASPSRPGRPPSAGRKVSGPGAVDFAHPKDADTTAAFDAAGTYVLRLTATDSQLTVKDEVTVVVTGADPVPTVVRCQGARRGCRSVPAPTT